MVGNQGMGGIRVPPKDWSGAIDALRSELQVESERREAGDIAIASEVSKLGTTLRSQIDKAFARSGRKTAVATGSVVTVVVAVITALSNVWTKRIEVQAPKPAKDETAQTVSDLRKRLAELDDIVAEHRRALQQRPIVKDPDVVTAKR